jgi:hypothetical protein
MEEVFNAQTISEQERLRLRQAVGAKTKDIPAQFLVALRRVSSSLYLANWSTLVQLRIPGHEQDSGVNVKTIPG